MRTLLATLLLCSSSYLMAQQDQAKGFLPDKQIALCGRITVVSFTCILPVMPDSILWEFGDGQISHELNPVHSFEGLGSFTVKMFSWKDQAPDSMVREALVVLKPSPSAMFKMNETGEFTPFVRTFYDMSTHHADSMVKYTWGIDEERAVGGPQFNAFFHDEGLFRISLLVENNRGCTDSSELVIRINENGQVVGVKEQHSAEGMRVYPNPVKDLLFIESERKPGVIRISDMSGRTLRSYTDPAGSISIAELDAGFYFIEIIAGEERTVRKIQKTN